MRVFDTNGDPISILYSCASAGLIVDGRGSPPSSRTFRDAWDQPVRVSSLELAMALGIDPVRLAIMTALAMEMGVIIPPVGLNLFAVAGTTRVPLHEVIKGSSPFLFTDGCVLLLVVMFPILALWLPGVMVVSVFN